MKLKNINIDEVNRILAANEDSQNRKIDRLKSIKIHPETYRTLKRIQKNNNLKSIYSTIDILIVSVALAQISDSTYNKPSMKERLYGNS